MPYPSLWRSISPIRDTNLIRWIGELDFGDASLPYPEASHVPGSIWLGDLSDVPDTELVMLRDPQALGDDNNGKSDENGFAINLVKHPTNLSSWTQWMSLDTSIHPSMTVAIWIDWNQDRDWDDADEEADVVAANFGLPGLQSVAALLQVRIPSHALLGKTFARVRAYPGYFLSGMSPAGPAGIGEVCDYEVEVLAEGTTIPPGGVVHGYKWNDLDGNGIWNPGEPLLSGWTFWLDTNQSGQQDEGDMIEQTDTTGRFIFTGVPAGTYTLGEQMRGVLMDPRRRSREWSKDFDRFPLPRPAEKICQKLRNSPKLSRLDVFIKTNRLSDFSLP